MPTTMSKSLRTAGSTAHLSSDELDKRVTPPALRLRIHHERHATHRRFGLFLSALLAHHPRDLLAQPRDDLGRGRVEVERPEKQNSVPAIRTADIAHPVTSGLDMMHGARALWVRGGKVNLDFTRLRVRVQSGHQHARVAASQWPKATLNGRNLLGVDKFLGVFYRHKVGEAKALRYARGAVHDDLDALDLRRMLRDEVAHKLRSATAQTQ